jgi:hypothetical protein
MKGVNVFKIFFIVLGSLLVISILCWLLQEKKGYIIYILDKTVPDKSCMEHKSFNWVLTQQKYVHKNNKFYSCKDDYYGFFPQNNNQYKIKSLRLYETLSISDDLDMVYYTDTYGVTYEDWYNRPPDKLHSPLLYGRLNQNDYLLLSEMKRKKKLIMAEFNFLASPTSGLIRQKTESLFDFSWTGWVGCYINSLRSSNPNLPQWISVQYEQQYQKKWDFQGPGIILVHEKGGVIVLEARKYLDENLPEIVTGEYGQKTYQLPRSQKYSVWFDIIRPGQTNKVVSTYKIHTNKEGDKLLSKIGLSNEFPAIIEHLDDYKFYYFAGDFADRNLFMGTAYCKGVSYIARAFSFNSSGSKSTFFWRFYEPLVRNILSKRLGSAETKDKL